MFLSTEMSVRKLTANVLRPAAGTFPEPRPLKCPNVTVKLNYTEQTCNNVNVRSTQKHVPRLHVRCCPICTGGWALLCAVCFSENVQQFFWVLTIVPIRCYNKKFFCEFVKYTEVS